MEPEHQPHDEPHLPAPTLWPIGFAIGIVVALVGLIINPTLITPIGVVIAIVFGVLWAREATAEMRGEDVDVEPERRELRGRGRGDSAGRRATAVPRSGFLAGATLGLGAAIGGLITLPIAGFTIIPGFIRQQHTKVDLGPIANFGKAIGTSRRSCGSQQGEVSRRRPSSVTTGRRRSERRQSRASRSSRTTAPTSAARCRRTGRRTSTSVSRSSRSHANGPVTMDPVIPPATAVRATAVSTTPREPHRRAAVPRSTATSSRSSRAGSSSSARTPSRTSSARAPRRRSTVQVRRPGRAHRRPRADPLSHPAAA